jgi:tetratricopeptide (TPR) repeat protein
METIESSRKNIVIAIIGIFFCATAIYWQSAFFDLVWDDYGVIIRNEKIRSIPAAFSTFYHRAGSDIKYDPAAMTASNWRPLRTVVHAVTYKFFQLEPFWYHLLNIIFHALVAVMLFLLLLRITGDMLAAMIGALLFAVHPVNSEAVCWAKSLEDLMAAFFMLSSFLLILNLKNSKDKVKYNLTIATLACLTFGLAITAKLSVIFFPLFMLLFIALRKWQNDKNISQLALKWSIGSSFAMLIIAGTGVIARSTVLHKVAQSGYITGSCWTTWLSMPRVFLRYLRIELLPWPLFADYQNYPYATTMTDGVAWFYTLSFIIIFCALTWLFIRKKLLAPWLWFWSALIPFSNIIAMKQLGAERFLYIPTIAVAWLGAELFKRFSAQAVQNPTTPIMSRLKLVTALILISFSLITVQRSLDWSSEVALWETTVMQFPASNRPRQNLIKSYNRQQQPDRALPYALKLAEEFPSRDNIILCGYTLCLNRHYQTGIKILAKQKADIVLNNAGAAAAQRGDLNAAEKCFSLAASIAPNIAKYRINLQMLHRQRNAQ